MEKTTVRSTEQPGLARRIARIPLVTILIGILIVMIPVIVEQSLVVSLPLSRLWKNVLLAALTVPIAYGAYYLFVRYVERREMAELAASGAALEIGRGALLGMSLFVGTILVLALVGAYRLQGTNGPQVLAIPFLGAVTSGVFEEILFRGVLFRVIEKSLGAWIALAISAIIFGLLHLLNENATLIGALSVLFEAGILLAAAFMFTRRLWFPIGIHFAWNFTQSGIFGIAVSGNTPLPGLLRSSLTGPDWLTGGAFGAEASVVAVLLCVVVAPYLLVNAARRGHVIPPYWTRRRTS